MQQKLILASASRSLEDAHSKDSVHEDCGKSVSAKRLYSLPDRFTCGNAITSRAGPYVQAGMVAAFRLNLRVTSKSLQSHEPQTGVYLSNRTTRLTKFYLNHNTSGDS